MIKHVSRWHYLLLAAPLLTLVACGGGESGGLAPADGGFVAPTINLAPVAVDDSNSALVTTAALDGASATAGASSFVPLSMTPVTGGEQDKVAVFDLAKRLTLNALETVATTPSIATSSRAMLEETVACVSGSNTIRVVVAGDTADPDDPDFTISPGDTWTVTANNCNDGDGETVNGQISLTFNQSFDLADFIDPSACSPCTLAVTLTISNLQVSGSGGLVTVHGGINMTLSVFNTGVEQIEVSGSSLYVVAAGVGAIRLTGFAISTEVDGDLSTTNGQYTLASTALNGSIYVELTDVVSDIADDHPHSGTILIEGASSSALLVDILDSNSVQLTLDANGDSVPDMGYPVTVTWTELETEA